MASEDKQVGWKVLILDFMERYFYLICFATYAKQHGPDGFKKTFVEFMNENSSLRDMIDQGKDKLEWSRTVDAEKLEKLKEMMASPDYKVRRELQHNKLIGNKHFLGKYFQADPDNLPLCLLHLR